MEERINSETNPINNRNEGITNNRTARTSMTINKSTKITIPKYKARAMSPFSNTSTYGNIQTTVGNSVTSRSKINFNLSKSNSNAKINNINQLLQSSSTRYAENSNIDLI
jgi:hypothetical protein